jgi:hypothetical protein
VPKPLEVPRKIADGLQEVKRTSDQQLLSLLAMPLVFFPNLHLFIKEIPSILINLYILIFKNEHLLVFMEITHAKRLKG